MIENKTIMKRIFIPTLLATALLQYGCLKSPDYDQLSTNFVVATNTDTTTDFSTFHTYYISDSVAYLSDNATVDSVINDANSKQLVDAVKSNMTARGYTFVPKGAKPEMGVMLGVTKNTYIGVVYSGWWDAYAGWWDPWYWGWYYPYYYPWSVAYTVTTGSVILTIANLKDAQATQKLRIIWAAFMGGSVGTNIATNVQRGVDGINQSFAQSPLVRRTN
jgi:hypothetical protein